MADTLIKQFTYLANAIKAAYRLQDQTGETHTVYGVDGDWPTRYDTGQIWGVFKIEDGGKAPFRYIMLDGNYVVEMAQDGHGERIALTDGRVLDWYRE